MPDENNTLGPKKKSGEIQEALAKGSYEALRAELRAAMEANARRFGAVRDEGGWVPLWLAATYDDYIIVAHERTRKHYRVSWSRDEDGAIVLGDDVAEVEEETTFVPKDESAPASPITEAAPPVTRPSKQFTETVHTAFAVEESDGTSGTAARIKATGITADVVNANRRCYPRKVLQQAVADLQAELNESRVKGRLVLTGEAEHPGDKSGRPNLLETVVKWTSVGLRENGEVALDGEIIPTSKGKDLQAILAAGVPVGVSQRAYGESKLVTGEGGREIEEVTALTITAYDLVMEPSDPNGGVDAFEESANELGVNNMDRDQKNELQDLAAQLPEMVRKQVDEALRAKSDADRDQLLREALGVAENADVEAMIEAARKRAAQNGNAELREALGLDADADPVAEARRIVAEKERLEAERQQREVAEFVEKEVSELPYPEQFKAAFAEAVAEAAPKTMDEAKALINAKRVEYDKLEAARQLQAKGYPIGENLQIRGSMFERETGTPDFARTAFEITESLVKRGHARRRDWSRNDLNTSELLTMRLLEAFDKRYRKELEDETRRLNEAMDTTAVSLPYSVSRAIIEEMWPALIFPEVFGTDIAPALDTRIYYTEFAEESAASGTETAESVSIVALDTWYALSEGAALFGSVTVTDNGATTTYTERTDYIIDYSTSPGKIKALTGGSISPGDTVKVTYDWLAVLEGESSAIQGGKLNYSYVLLSLKAMRMAVEITKEAVVGARASLGTDARSSAIAAVINRLQRWKDNYIFGMAANAIQQISGATAGSWSMTTPASKTDKEHSNTLANLLNDARVIVAENGYEIDSFVVSMTVGAKLARSDYFTAAGLVPGMNMNANGLIGALWSKPVFQAPSSRFTDSMALAVTRDLLEHRLLEGEPMSINGPHTRRSSDALVPGEIWFAEEFQGSVIPVAKKGAIVLITS